MNKETNTPEGYIEKLVQANNRRLNWIEEQCSKPNQTFKHFSNFLHSIYENQAWVDYLVNKNIADTKQNFNNCSLIDCERIDRFDTRLFDYGRTHVSYCALSDNQELIKRYAQLNYQINYTSRGKEYNSSYREFVEQGEDCIYCDLMIKAMNRDMDGLAHNLKIVENITLKKKTREWMRPDYEFFKAILNKDKDKVFELVEFISSKKQHNLRNKEDILKKQFVSQPGIGFAKIAWINELQIEPTSNKIFNDLLPVSPNNKYENPVQDIILRLDGNKINVADIEPTLNVVKKKSWWKSWNK